VSGSRRDRLDAWLFLPPELERDGPALLALLDDPEAPERALPAREREVEKDRHRWLVAFRGVQFYVHVDHMVNPHAGACFLEVKSRTWSRRDAQDKAAIIAELLELLGARPGEAIEEGYVEL